jgi:hypothetical protein
VVEPHPHALAHGMVQLVSDPALYERLQANAMIWSRSLTFDAGMEMVGEVIGESIAK